jgi:hypothetical protein
MFSYDLSASDADTLAISQVRMRIGDNVPGRGVLPGDDNLQDDEITQVLSDNDGDVTEAVIDLCTVLASRWSIVANASRGWKDGNRSESLGQIAQAWAQRAQELRREHPQLEGKTFNTPTSREDGYTT